MCYLVAQERSREKRELQLARVEDRSPAEHGAENAGRGEVPEPARERVAIDDDQVGVAPGPERPDARSAEHASRVIADLTLR